MRDYKMELCKYIDENWQLADDQRKKFFSNLHSSKYICLFGAGQVGQAVAYDLAEIGVKIDFFCDNNEKLWDTNIYFGIRCISIHNLKQYKDDVFVLITTGYYKQVWEQLVSHGFQHIYVVPQLMIKNNAFWDKADCAVVKNKFSQLIDILHDEKSKEITLEIVNRLFSHSSNGHHNYKNIKTEDQYFPSDIIELTDNEIFVDVGAFDGDTIREFLLRTEGKFDQIIAYELDKNCYRMLDENIQSMDDHLKRKIILYNLGLYNQNEKIKYGSNSTSSAIHSLADHEGEVVRLSDHVENDKITFIKMDIEGAEVKALEGAEEIIKACKPKLAICVYHEPAHLWEIPLYIKELVPEYKIYIRHHHELEFETVCYAVL